MRSAVIVFPGSNCDRDITVALHKASGQAPHRVFHKDTDLPDVDLIVVPGGFSYGDYLRCGAMAAHSPIMVEVKRRAERGVRVFGVCNGFQILTEAGLLPGALIRNRDLRYLCRTVSLRVEQNDTAFTRHYAAGQIIHIPIGHGEGNYVADDVVLDRLEGDGLVAFRYTDNPNGATRDIAGIYNPGRTVLGMMPHPERAFEPLHGNTDGRPFFDSLVECLA